MEPAQKAYEQAVEKAYDRYDNTMVQGIVLLYACVGIIGLILGDLLMVLIDPRINFGKKEGGR